MSQFIRADATLPDWRPLQQRVAETECADFMWMYQEGDVHFYKHIITRRYLVLDSEGACFRWVNGELSTANFELEYLRVTG